jgi:hypothetical protein
MVWLVVVEYVIIPMASTLAMILWWETTINHIAVNIMVSPKMKLELHH